MGKEDNKILSNYAKQKEKYKYDKNVVINPLTNRAVKINSKTYKKLLRNRII